MAKFNVNEKVVETATGKVGVIKARNVMNGEKTSVVEYMGQLTPP